MRITAPAGSGCIGDEPVIVTVEDCDDPENVVWTVKYPPGNEPQPTITPIGNGQYEVSAPVAGSYVIEAECCG